MAGRGRLAIKASHGWVVDQLKVFLLEVEGLRPSTKDPPRVAPREVQCLQPSTRGWPSTALQTASSERGLTQAEGVFRLKAFLLKLNPPRSVGSGGSRRSREDSIGNRPSEFLQVISYICGSFPNHGQWALWVLNVCDLYLFGR